jgi:uncharacterized coiled-coil protein SlyX
MTKQQDVIDLEMRIMTLESQFQDLSDVAADQWKIIDILKGNILKQQDRIATLESGNDKSGGGEDTLNDARDNIPPHY